jgi:hypothetical protein
VDSKKKRTRIRRKNMGIKKLILFFILIFIIIQLIRVIVPASVTFSRYAYNKIRSYYLSSKAFYFTSDKLSTENSFFEADNWSGTDAYRVDINMYSKKNNAEVSKVKIDYTIKYELSVYDSNNKKYSDSDVSKMIEFYIKKNSGQILPADNKDDFYFTISSKTGKDAIELKDDDYVVVKITASSTSPYKETLTGEFKISVGNLGMKYQIEDTSYNSYFEVVVTNTLNYYTVDTPFTASGSGTTYKVGNHIEIQDYLSLTDDEKAKCHSMLINLEITDEYYDKLNFDTTSNLYVLALENATGNYKITTQTKGSYSYVKSMQFPIEAEESKVIRFYKNDDSADYTYPFNTTGIDNPVILVTCDYDS